MTRKINYEYMAGKQNDYRQSIIDFAEEELESILEGVSFPERAYSNELRMVRCELNERFIDAKQLRKNLDALSLQIKT